VGALVRHRRSCTERDHEGRDLQENGGAYHPRLLAVPEGRALDGQGYGGAEGVEGDRPTAPLLVGLLDDLSLLQFDLLVDLGLRCGGDASPVGFLTLAMGLGDPRVGGSRSLAILALLPVVGQARLACVLFGAGADGFGFGLRLDAALFLRGFGGNAPFLGFGPGAGPCHLGVDGGLGLGVRCSSTGSGVTACQSPSTGMAGLLWPFRGGLAVMGFGSLRVSGR
jgi:hypothetical protein